MLPSIYSGKNLFVILTLLIAGFCQPVFSEDEDEEDGSDDEVFDMSLASILEIEITTGSKTAVSFNEAPAIMSVFSRKDIEELGFRTIEDVLNHVPGFSTGRTNQQSAAATSITVRGSKVLFGENVLFLVDGQRINDPNSGGGFGANPTMLIGNYERIEIIRGPGSALYGANAFVGVVNLITAQKDIEAGWRVTAGAGDIEGRSLNAAFNQNFGNDVKLATRLEYYHQYYDTIDYPDNIQILFTPYPDRVGREELESTVFSARMSFSEFMLSLRYTENDNAVLAGLGVPRDGLYTDVRLIDYENVNDRGEDMTGSLENLNIGLNWNREFSDSLQLDAVLTYSEVESELITPFVIAFPHFITLGFGTYPTGAAITDNASQGTAFESKSWNLDTYFTWSLNDKNTTVAGINWQQDEVFEVSLGGSSTGEYSEDINGDPIVIIGGDGLPLPLPVTLTDGAPPLTVVGTPNIDDDRTIFALYAQHIWKATDDFTVTAGFRYDDYDDVGSSFNPRLALVYSLAEATTFKLLAATAFRAPSFQEAYRSVPPVLVPNANVEPEELESIELQASHKMDNLNLSLNLYNYSIDNAIFQQPIGGGAQTYVNAGSSEAQGIEAELSYVIANQLRVSAGLSHVLDATTTVGGVEADSEGLPNIGANVRAMLYANDYTFSLAAYHNGDFNRRNEISTGIPGIPPLIPAVEIDDVTVIDLNMHKDNLFDENSSISLLLHNVTDERRRGTENQLFYPVGLNFDGRQVMLKLSYSM